MGLIARQAKVNSPGLETTYVGLVTEGADKRIMDADLDAELNLIFSILGVAGGIESINLGVDSVQTPAIQNGAVNASKLATDAVETAKIKDGAVTSAKILDGTVASADQVVNGSLHGFVSANVTASLSFTTTETDLAVTPSLSSRGGRIMFFPMCILEVDTIDGQTGLLTIRYYRDTTVLRTVAVVVQGSSGGVTVTIPAMSVDLAAGSYTFKVSAQNNNVLFTVRTAGSNAGVLSVHEAT